MYGSDNKLFAKMFGRTNIMLLFSRDEALRFLLNLSKLLTAITLPKGMERKLIIFDRQISDYLTISHIFDTILINRSIIERLKMDDGKFEDKFFRCCTITQSALLMISCPIQCIYWAGKRNIVSIDINRWNVAAVSSWAAVLHISLIRSLENIQFTHREKLHLQKNIRKYYCENCIHEIEKDHEKITHTLELQKYSSFFELANKQWKKELLTSTRFALDITYVISYLPVGILWGGRLKTWQVGALGILSSLIGFYELALCNRIVALVTSRDSEINNESNISNNDISINSDISNNF